MTPGAHTVAASYPGGGFDSIVIEVQQPPPPAVELKLFLDAEPFGFQQPSDDDLADYVPGSYLSNGASRPAQSEGTALDTVRLIAAFVDSSGQIVAPPTGVTRPRSGFRTHRPGRATR